MKANGKIVSLLITAALSLPVMAYAAGTQERVPGSTDEARVAAQRASQPSTPSTSGYDDPAAVLRASSSDEARALAGRREAAPTPLAQPSDCIQAGAIAAGSTDAARASFGRRLEECSQHA